MSICSQTGAGHGERACTWAGEDVLASWSGAVTFGNCSYAWGRNWIRWFWDCAGLRPAWKRKTTGLGGRLGPVVFASDQRVIWCGADWFCMGLVCCACLLVCWKTSWWRAGAWELQGQV